MLIHKILACRLALAAAAVIVAACGQTGALYLPTPPAGVHRASLPESLLPASLMKAPAANEVERDAATSPAKAASQPKAAP